MKAKTEREAPPGVKRSPMLALGVLACTAIFLMFIGGGRSLTWAGATGFVIVLWLFAWIAIRSVK